MNKNDLDLFIMIAKMSQNSLLKSMTKLLKQYYSKNKIRATSKYILCEGDEDTPIMLTAHMDTVFKSPPKNIYYDREHFIMWSPEGLGADDRAGVFAIIKILQAGYRPSICLTTDEEKGSIGAGIMVTDIPQCPFNLKYIIELDRRGKDDCVFYSCNNEGFIDYVETFGFLTNWGTFSDISYICPTWEIAGVNLSVGYENEHSKAEFLDTEALYSTIQKVKNMLKDSDKEETPCFEYIEDDFSWYYYPYFGTSVANTKKLHQCSGCYKIFPSDDVFLVKTKNRQKKYYCIDCVSDNVNWCEKCGEPFEMSTANETICSDCANNILDIKNGK